MQHIHFEILDPAYISSSFSLFCEALSPSFLQELLILFSDDWDDREATIVGVIMGVCILVGLILWDQYEGKKPWARPAGGKSEGPKT